MEKFFPLFFLVFIPLARLYYLFREEYLKRVFLLIFFISLSILYLSIFDSKNSRKLKDKISFFENLELKKIILILFLISFFFFNLSLLFALKNGLIYLGDEPHYLLISHSIIFDRDLNLRNNYLNLDYKIFYPGELGFHAHYGKKGDSYWFSFHLPGLPFFLIPFYWVSLKFPFLMNYLPRAFITFFAVFCGIQLFLLLLQLGISRFNSFLIWIIFSLTSPFLFFSFHIYPEPISLALSIYILRKFLNLNFKTADNIFIPLSFLIFPWLGAKYILVAIPILFFGLYFSIKKKTGIKMILLSFFSFTLSYFLFLLLLYSWFGTFSTFSLYHGVLTKENLSYLKNLILFKIPLTMRIETLLGYFFDQRDGFFFYSPIYFFSFLGFFEMIRRKRNEAISILLTSLPFLFNYAFLTHRGGASPQARTILPVFFIFPVFLSYFIEFNKGKIFRLLFFSSLVFSICTTFILLENPQFLYQPTTHEVTERSGAMFGYLSNFWINLPSLLPSFIKSDTSYYLPNYLWLFLTFIFILFYLFKEKMKRIDLEIPVMAIILIIISIYFVLLPRGYLYGGKKIFYNLKTKLSFHSIPENVEIERDIIKVNNKGKFEIPFTSFKKIEKIYIDHKGRGRIFVSDVLADKGAFVKSPNYVNFKGRYLYLLRIFAEEPMEIIFSPDG